MIADRLLGNNSVRQPNKSGTPMRSLILNKILSLQYRLGKLIGRKKARSICSLLEKCFVTVFGREIYHEKK